MPRRASPCRARMTASGLSPAVNGENTVALFAKRLAKTGRVVPDERSAREAITILGEMQATEAVPALYAVHLLVEAKNHKLPVPQDLPQKANTSLEGWLGSGDSTLDESRHALRTDTRPKT